MNIGEVAAACGVSAKMIRYYEGIGLIPKARRSESGYRHYDDAEVHSLRFIRRARDFGFTVEQLAALLALWRDRSRASAEVKALALTHVDELNRRIGNLQAVVRTLSTLADHCGGDDRPDCPIIDNLTSSDNVTPAPRAPRRFEPGSRPGRRRSNGRPAGALG